MSRHHRHHSPVKKTPQEQNPKQSQRQGQKTTQKQNPAPMNPNGEVVKLLQRLVETTESLVKINRQVVEKIDGLGNNLGTKIDNLGTKIDVLINHVRNIRGELSETSLLKLFVEDLRAAGYKVEVDPSGVIKGDKVDYIIKVRKGKEEKTLYVEVRTAIVPSSVKTIKKKFKDVEGEKWILARFIDNAALESLKDTDINIYSYDEEVKGLRVIKNGVLTQPTQPDTPDNPAEPDKADT